MSAKSNVAAQIVLGDDEQLSFSTPGYTLDSSALTLPRSNPNNVLFRNESDEERDRDAEGGNGDRNAATGQQLANDVAAEPIAAQPQPRLTLGYDILCSNRCVTSRGAQPEDGAVCLHLGRK